MLDGGESSFQDEEFADMSEREHTQQKICLIA